MTELQQLIRVLKHDIEILRIKNADLEAQIKMLKAMCCRVDGKRCLDSDPDDQGAG